MMTKQETHVQLKALTQEREQTEALIDRYTADRDLANELEDMTESTRMERELRKANKTLQAVDRQISLLSGRAEPRRQAQAQRTEKPAAPTATKR